MEEPDFVGNPFAERVALIMLGTFVEALSCHKTKPFSVCNEINLFLPELHFILPSWQSNETQYNYDHNKQYFVLVHAS